MQKEWGHINLQGGSWAIWGEASPPPLPLLGETLTWMLQPINTCMPQTRTTYYPSASRCTGTLSYAPTNNYMDATGNEYRYATDNEIHVMPEQTHDIPQPTTTCYATANNYMNATAKRNTPIATNVMPCFCKMATSLKYWYNSELAIARVNNTYIQLRYMYTCHLCETVIYVSL